MITVIERDNNSINENAYAGMTLAEACYQAMLEVNEIANDLQMNVLLNEHKYLYENGSEIIYEADGAPTKDGKSVKEWLIAQWDKFSTTISSLWDRMITWVQTQVNSLSVKLAKVGFTNKKLQEISDDLNKNGDYTLQNPLNLREINIDEFKGIKVTEFIKKYNNKPFDDAKKEIEADTNIIKNVEVSKISNIDFASARESLSGTNSDFIKNIIVSKRTIIKEIKDKINGFKADKMDNIEDSIKSAKDEMKNTTGMSSYLIKLYHDYVAYQVAILKAGITCYKARNAKKPAKEEKAPTNTEAPKAEEVKQESTIYNGKFFKV